MKKILLAVAVVGMLCGRSSAQTTLFWSGNGTTQGGAGTWNTTDARWGTVAAGPYTTVWNNANIDSANFGGTASTAVTMAGPITVNTITTAIGGFTIGITSTNGTAANTLNFSGTNAGVNTLQTSGTTTLTAMTTGTLTKTGPGRLELNNTMNQVTKYFLNAGMMSFANATRFGAAPGGLVTDFFTFNGGGLASSGATTTVTGDLGANRGVSILANGAFFGGSNAANIIVVSGPISGSAGGSLNVTNGGPFLSPLHAGATVVISNTGNSYNGATNLGLGTLRLGAAGVIPDGSNVTVTGGTFDLNGFNETVAGVTLNGGSAVISGAGTLSATSYDLRSSGTVSAILGGTAAATKTTGGTVTLTGLNTYSGNTQIDAGTLAINSVGALGNGVGGLIMNGGKLNTTASRGVTTAPIANPLSVDASSEITTTSTAGTVDLRFTSNSISGDGGTTLTFRNDAASGTGLFQPSFSGSGFNYAANIAVVNGAFGTTSLNSFNALGTDQTFSGVISGTGSFRRSFGTGLGGSTTFTNDNTYQGGTIINDGIVYASNTNPAGSATGTGTVTVSGDGTLAGTGYVSGAVTVNSGGTVSPGASIDSLDVGALTFNGGSSFDYEIDSAAGTADLLTSNLVATVSTGDLSIALDGTATLNTDDLAGSSVSLAGTTFTLINYEGAYNGGTFAGLPNGGYIIGLGLNDWQINYADTNPGINNPGGTGMFVTITAAVPEASSFLAVGVAAVVAGGVTWFRRKRAA